MLMNEIEDPAATVARLLRTNLCVIKDNETIANVNVTNEWQSNEALRGYDGQITVSVAESLDQKLELNGKMRKRVCNLRVSAWASEQLNSSESARIMRGKIVEEINRVIRQNRSCPNQTSYSFYNTGPLSQTQKVYQCISEEPPKATQWIELSGSAYEQLWKSDDNRHQVNATELGNCAALLFGFKLESRKNTNQIISFLFEGYGTAPLGNGVTIKAWNKTNCVWDNAQSGSFAGIDEVITLTLLQNLTDYVDKDGYVWFLARTFEASDGITPAILKCDYIRCAVTVRGITYCDVLGYRDADRVDVKPFIFRTEFTLKSWFFENIGV